MSTEYRRGIPSTVHVEAATRLGLLWEDDDVGTMKARWRLEAHADGIRGDYATSNTNYTNWDSGPLVRAPVRNQEYRPIRSDGTPVDWEVLDQEVARVGQPVTVTPTASAQPISQPEGFRADLFRRIASHFDLVIRDAVGDFVARIVSVRGLVDVNAVGIHANDYQWGWGTTSTPVPGPVRADILARWTVYQELKPLYDLVEGAQGEVAMPADVEAEWSVCSGGSDTASGNWRLCRNGDGLYAQGVYVRWHPSEGDYGTPLRNFAAVLDAVAERRVVERMRGQTQAPIVTSAQPEPVLDEAALRSLILNLPNVASIISRIERGSRQRDRYIVRVQLADPNVPLDRALAAQIPRNVHVHCEGRGDGGQRGVGGTASSIFSPTGNREDAVVPPIQEPRHVNVEPRRFADVRPDRHGWRWWRAFEPDQTLAGNIEIRPDGWRWYTQHTPTRWHTWDLDHIWLNRTVIPTDEQGNPVSWETAGFAAEVTRPAQETAQRATKDATPTRSVGDIEWTPPRPGQFNNDFTASAPITAESFARVLQQMDRSAMVAATRFAETPQTRALVEAQRAREEAETRARVLQQVREGVRTNLSVREAATGNRQLSDAAKAQRQLEQNTVPLPRFTADELDDVDHSKTTKLDEVTLRRGKLPTVEQIAKYREVQTRRTGGAVADALKESRIDCEVAQYVLERWAGGLGDANVLAVIEEVRFLDCAVDVDKRAAWFIGLMCNRLDTSEKPSPTVQRERQEAEERRQRLAELRQRLAAERAAQPAEEAPTTNASRFDLIEPDPQADPAASVRAWEARQAAAKVRPVTVPRTAKPATAPRRPAIEVVDAEVDGLSRSEVFAALFGRALNGGC